MVTYVEFTVLFGTWSSEKYGPCHLLLVMILGGVIEDQNCSEAQTMMAWEVPATLGLGRSREGGESSPATSDPEHTPMERTGPKGKKSTRTPGPLKGWLMDTPNHSCLGL